MIVVVEVGSGTDTKIYEEVFVQSKWVSFETTAATLSYHNLISSPSSLHVLPVTSTRHIEGQTDNHSSEILAVDGVSDGVLLRFLLEAIDCSSTDFDFVLDKPNFSRKDDVADEVVLRLEKELREKSEARRVLFTVEGLD